MSDHAVILHQMRAKSLIDNFALIEHVSALSGRKCSMGVLLDEKDRESLRVQASKRLKNVIRH